MSGDHELAIGTSRRSRHDGMEEGPFLSVTGSEMLRASVVVAANIFVSVAEKRSLHFN